MSVPPYPGVGCQGRFIGLADLRRLRSFWCANAELLSKAEPVVADIVEGGRLGFPEEEPEACSWMAAPLAVTPIMRGGGGGGWEYAGLDEMEWMEDVDELWLAMLEAAWRRSLIL